MARSMPTHGACWNLTHLLRDESAESRAVVASQRLLELAPGLPPDSHITLVIAGDGNGQVRMELHSDTDSKLVTEDIEWVFDKIGIAELITEHGDSPLPALSSLNSLFEVAGAGELPAISYSDVDLVEPHEENEQSLRRRLRYWPSVRAGDRMDLMSALVTCEAQVRVHIAPANDLEQKLVAAQIRESVGNSDPVKSERYMGTPVRIRCFVGTSEDRLPPRLRAALLSLGVGLRIQTHELDEETRAMWDGDETSLVGCVQPFGVAQCLVPVPACGTIPQVCGMKTREAKLDAVPLVDVDLPVEGVRLGTAVDELGRPLEVRLRATDLLLHTQILGATGTGKSSLLAGIVNDAVRAGYGVTVLDPHGPLVDRLITELPPEAVDRTIAIYSDDLANPVPVNVLASEDGDLVIDVMMQVISDLFDPRKEGIVGPRFERASSQIVRAQQALVGNQANFAAVPFWLSDRGTISKVAELVSRIEPDLGAGLKSEMVDNRSNDFSEVLAWVNSKYNRLTNSAELRAILLSGLDAVNVTDVIDDHQVLLVKLASTEIGALGAQFLGEMWLMKHWLAMSKRVDTSRPHLIIVDEAQLFGAGILPRMLAEARKFGMGIVIAHQHLGQLGSELREAALATTNNVIAFRSGPMEASATMMRLGSWSSGLLTRLPRLSAAATLSSGREQTEPFSLIVDHNQRVSHADPEVAVRVRERTIEEFVDPYRDAEPWSVARVVRTLQRVGREQEYAAQARRDAEDRTEGGGGSGSSFLDEWLARRRDLRDQESTNQAHHN